MRTNFSLSRDLWDWCALRDARLIYASSAATYGDGDGGFEDDDDLESLSALRPLNADISTLAFTFWLIHREKSLDANHGLTDAYEQLADTMTRTLATLDRTACDPTGTTPDDDGWRYWPEVFEDQASGGLYA